jgi:hypothetical protein
MILERPLESDRMIYIYNNSFQSQLSGHDTGLLPDKLNPQRHLNLRLHALQRRAHCEPKLPHNLLLGQAEHERRQERDERDFCVVQSVLSLYE